MLSCLSRSLRYWVAILPTSGSSIEGLEKEGLYKGTRIHRQRK